MLLTVNKEGLPAAIRSIGPHQASIPIFANKAEIQPLKLFQVRTPAANAIKQEMLCVGGDAVLPVGCLVNKDKYVDILLLGTRKHYALVAPKLQQMPFFGIADIGRELESYLQPKTIVTVLRDGRTLTYEKLRVMGILNVTPDSFYAGSRCSDVTAAVKAAERMLQEGADILDIGAESTRPGSSPVTEEEEKKRLLPVIKAIRQELPAAILSVDTWRAATAEAALVCGADIVNDITAFSGDARMAEIVAREGAAAVLMHMRGTPADMQEHCDYTHVVDEVALYLAQRLEFAVGKGVGREKLIVDPGIGFAKSVEQNLLLLRDLQVLTGLGCPVLVAASRKSTIGTVLGGLPPEERLEGTLATSLQAVYAGAHLVRVHDVKENVRAIRMLEAILQ